MDEKIRCQSCGMPLEDDMSFNGTMADGSKDLEYCQFCFQNGEFTAPDMTVDQMVQSSVDFMTANMGFALDQAREMSQRIIPRLKRWQDQA
jgi:Putative zinc ribbon domain